MIFGLLRPIDLIRNMRYPIVRRIMKNGFLVVVFNVLIELLVWLNIDEILKKIAVRFLPEADRRDAEKIRRRCNYVIDTFIISKWTFVLLAFFIGWTSNYVFWITWYLLIINVFGYFYHHAWIISGNLLVDNIRQQRRFLNLLLAIGFYLFCYANLYLHFYPCQIDWPNDGADELNALYLSVANAFTLTYGDFAAKTQTARVLFMSQLIITFIMLAIVLAKTIPDYTERE